MNSRWKASLLLFVMFVLGLISGIALQNYRYPRLGYHSMYVSRRIHHLEKDLNLTPDQEKTLKEIFDRAHDRAAEINEEVSWDLADIHRDSVTAMRNVLTPAQRTKFDELHQKWHAHRHEPMEEPEKDDGTSGTNS